MADLVGQIVGGKYRVTGRLGGGGVSEVYEAVHEEIGQHFALKVLKREYANYPDGVQRFFLEARAASAAGHPGIVQVFDIGRLDDGTPYLMMELLQGESLADVLRRRRKLPQDQAVGVCLHILDALAAAHRAGVIHRDLKPENVVLVRGPGGEPWAKLIDFGIARLAREGPAALRQTGHGTVMGTPYYMSPEQARGSPDIDARSDIYSVGVMLFEMIAGKLPFEGQSSEEILVQVLSAPFPSLRALEPSVPPALESVVRTATQRRRDDRYRTALEFAEALRPLRAEMVAVRMLTPEEEAALVDEDEASSIRRIEELAARVPDLVPPAPGSIGPPRTTPPRLPARRSTPPRTTPHPATPPAIGPRTGRFPAAQPRLTPRPSRPPPGSDAALVRSTGGHPALTPVRVSTRPSPPPPGEGSQPEPRGTPPGTPPGTPRPSYPDLRSDSIPPGHAALILPRRALFLLLALGIALVAASLAALLIALSGRPEAANPRPTAPEQPPGARVTLRPAPESGGGDAGSAGERPDRAMEDEPPDGGGPAPDATAAAAASETGGTPDIATLLENPDAPDANAPAVPRVTVRVRGVPRGARATVDDLPVDRQFDLPRDGAERRLRVTAPGYRDFELRFVPAEGLVLHVRLERGDAGTADDGGIVADDASGPPSDGRTSPGTDARAPLANPFSTR